jgi:hypothetical protein
MKSAEDNVGGMNSAPNPRLSNTTCNSSKFSINKSHNPVVSNPHITVHTHSAEHIQAT